MFSAEKKKKKKKNILNIYQSFALHAATGGMTSI
jgi:hypothetical protein